MSDPSFVDPRILLHTSPGLHVGWNSPKEGQIVDWTKKQLNALEFEQEEAMLALISSGEKTADGGSAEWELAKAEPVVLAEHGVAQHFAECFLSNGSNWKRPPNNSAISPNPASAPDAAEEEELNVSWDGNDTPGYVIGASIAAAFGVSLVGCLVFYCSSGAKAKGSTAWGYKGSSTIDGPRGRSRQHRAGQASQRNTNSSHYSMGSSMGKSMNSTMNTTMDSSMNLTGESLWSDSRAPSQQRRSQLNSSWTSRSDPHTQRSLNDSSSFRQPTKRVPMNPMSPGFQGTPLRGQSRVNLRASTTAVPSRAGGVRKVHVDFMLGV
jgi:hypothetical protein